MKRFLAAAWLLAAASVVSGQAAASGAPGGAACGLTAAQAPDVKGLRLGLTARHVFELFPGSGDDQRLRAELSEAPGKFGVASIVIRPESYAPNPALAGVNQITIKFIDERVANFTVGYTGPEWRHVDDFIAKLVEGTRLPGPGAWEVHVGMDTQLKNLKCRDFEMSVFAGGKNVNLNYVTVRDTVAEQKLKERKAKAREAKAQP